MINTIVRFFSELLSGGKHRPFYAEKKDTHHAPPRTELLFSVLLIGDAGAVATDGHDDILQLVCREMATEAHQKQAIIFLGDNIYPRGLPPQNHRLRENAEKVLEAQLSVLQEFKGKFGFLSGNHDWNKGRPNGFEYVARQEAYLNEKFKANEQYLPLSLVYSGPEEILLNDNLLLVVINTQWWVQEGYTPIDKAYSSIEENRKDFFRHLNAILSKNSDKKILIVGHHPMYSNALHAGKFTLKQHLFPLTALHKSLYIPLPVIGSLYPLYRKLFGAKEDMVHYRYRYMRKRLLAVFRKHKNIIYAAGHEHNLQYFNNFGNHYIVSGAGSKIAFVKKGGQAIFAHAHKGVAQIRYYKGGQVWLYFLEPSDQETDQTIVKYQKRLI